MSTVKTFQYLAILTKHVPFKAWVAINEMAFHRPLLCFPRKLQMRNEHSVLAAMI